MNKPTIFGQILSIHSKDIERERNSDINQGPRNSAPTLQKIKPYIPFIDLVNVNVYTKLVKFGPFQDTERKRYSNIN